MPASPRYLRSQPKSGSLYPPGGILPKIIRAVKNEKAGTECQPVSLGVAHAIAQQRPGLLAALSDEAYQKALERLTDEARDRGAKTLNGSGFTLVEILAVKGEQPKPKRRRPSFRKAGEVLVVVSVRGLHLTEQTWCG